MFFFRLFFLFFLSMNLFAQDAYIDSITLSKIKKLVQKEEEIAYAYKKYIREKAMLPSLDTLKSNGYLADSFSVINPFGKIITINALNNQIESFLPNNVALKSNVNDYYYADDNRINTKAPLSIENNNVEIVLSPKEKFIVENILNITTVKANAINKYYLDENGILIWYNLLQQPLFSYDMDKLLVYEAANLINIDGTINSVFELELKNKGVLYAGGTVLNIGADGADEYLNIGNTTGIIKVNEELKDIGKTVIQFTRRAGGMIVNGDIYTWGNNANKITGIDIDNYTVENGGNPSSWRYPVITGLVRMKVKSDNSTINTKKYFSSPLRAKFSDFFSTVFAGTCGVTTKGELYCGGKTGIDYTFGTSFTHVDDSSNSEMLYKSSYFNGGTTAPKAKKVFSNNQIWLILSEDGDIYRWGYDWSGFSGNGSLKYNNGWQINTSLIPMALTVLDGATAVKFSDITYLLTIGYRKMGALSTDGDIYIWGVENNIAYGQCSVYWENKTMNLCAPLKVESQVGFESIHGSLEAFLAFGKDGNYYKIHQPKDKKPQVISISDLIKTYGEYDVNDDEEILSVDFSSKLSGSSLLINQGVVWVNSKNELKGDYFTSQNVSDQMFKDAISKIKWKKIKVIQDDNGMCGIDIYNQMYCWGIMSYYRDGSGYYDYMGNTFMIPVFNTNLYDLDKDYLVAQGGYSGYLTNMTSGDWATTNSDGKSGAFFMKYPTYIGGFNYEFIFK